ncbi:MAG: efflux RND transporter permease subunit [bacterium]
MTHREDQSIVATTHNTARFFTENRHVAWTVLVAVVVWGIYGYLQMSKRKDPDIPVRVAMAVTPWPGVRAETVEQLVTRRVERAIAENPWLRKPGDYDFALRSLSLDGLSIVWVQLDERAKLTKQEFDNIHLALDQISDLPRGAGPVQWNGDFGDTAALMLTVASPRESDVSIELRARAIADAVRDARAGIAAAPGARAAVVVAYPFSLGTRGPERIRDRFASALAEAGLATAPRPIDGSGFVGLDFTTAADDDALLAATARFREASLGSEGDHPDVWDALVVRDPAQIRERLARVAGPRYSHHELEQFTGLIQRSLRAVPQVSKVDRTGVLERRVILQYAQERLAAYGVRPSALGDLLESRSATLSGAALEVGGKRLLVEPANELESADAIGDVLVPTNSTRSLHLRDLVDVIPAYESPARLLNFYTARAADGSWYRGRAVTLAVQMRAGEQIHAFGEAVDRTLDGVRRYLPDDLVLARTSDQPLQVEENVDLFMDALIEAIVLVVAVAWVGFREWRSALLMALSIPLTLAMTFGMMQLLGIDVQQVSIAALIIALGLLVDDPVVAGDAIKRDLALGHPPVVAAWLGPTKLARAILFATVTNIAAYLPFLLLSGDTGKFLYSLPIVMTCSLIASRLVSMTFIPLLGYYLLRPSSRPEPSLAERRARGFTGAYYRVGTWAIEHRKLSMAIAAVFLVLGGGLAARLKTQFFPDDLQYLSYVDVWLPNDAPLTATREAATRADEIIRAESERMGAEHPAKDGGPTRVLRSITSFVGGGGPRFWMSVSPEPLQTNYAQLVLEATDKHLTHELVGRLQVALSRAIPGARIDVKQLQTNPVEFPVEVRLSARTELGPQDEARQLRVLRGLADRVKDALRAVPTAARVRDDWGEETLVLGLEMDEDRAATSGITNPDLADSSRAAISGVRLTTLRDGDQLVPVLARQRLDERSQLSDLESLYVYGSSNTQRVPLGALATVEPRMETPRIRRRDQFRTISVQAYPAQGVLASEVMAAATPSLEEIARTLPPGFELTIGGERAKQRSGFRELAVVLAISAALIFLSLVTQFSNAVKPFLVFAAVPFGAMGALALLWAFGTPFGFMAFLGVVSLVGVIVSHVIVLFDFIEEMHERGEPLIESLLDAGIARLRPVAITVGATVLALVPLALHGGPLWEPLCYAQIGGLLVATVVELVLVPVLYAVFVLDLGIVRWSEASRTQES